MSSLPGSSATSHWPRAVYRAEQVRELDRIAIDELGVPGFELMSRAGRAAFSLLESQWPEARRIIVYCGAGNNGGDGYIVASLAKQCGWTVAVRQVGDFARLSGDARRAYQQAVAAQVPMHAFNPDETLDADVVVDALLGTGLRDTVRGDFAAAVHQINTAAIPVLALDIPTGLCADTGSVLGVTVRARVTITFIGMKQGLLTFNGPDACGALFFASLDVPQAVYKRLPADCLRVTRLQVDCALPRRARNTHKGDCGRVLVVGGDHGFGGAAIMAAQAAARVGAGLISLLTRPDHIAAALTRCPEIMVRGVEEGDAIQDALARCDVVVAGPGIGRNSWGAFLLEQVLDSDRAVVLDADGLNYLAALGEQSSERMARGNWVLTPHPGEAARLLGCSSQAVQGDRFKAVRQLQMHFRGAVILKGNGTLVAGQSDQLAMVTAGNPGMASGGMGDVLSGVVGGLLAQGLTLESAAAIGAWLHATAGDCAAQAGGERGLLATDLLGPLQHLVNGAWAGAVHDGKQ